MIAARWMLLLVAGAAVLAPRAAHACSCAGFGWTEPANGATDVPVNTKLWRIPDFAAEYPIATYRLVGPNGDVPMETKSIGPPNGPPTAPFGLVLTPRQL